MTGFNQTKDIYNKLKKATGNQSTSTQSDIPTTTILQPFLVKKIKKIYTNKKDREDLSLLNSLF